MTIGIGDATRAAVDAALMAATRPAVAPASWTEPLFLSGPGLDASAPAVAMDQNGDALVVWNRVDGAFNRIEPQARTASGVWGTVSPPLSAAGQHATNADVALDQDGDALIVWLRSNGTE